MTGYYNFILCVLLYFRLLNMTSYFASERITSFDECNFPQGVKTVYCENTHISSFEHLPNSVKIIYCENTPISSFEHLPNSVKVINCDDTSITSFEHLHNSVIYIYCNNTQISSFEHLPNSVKIIDCSYTQISSFEHLPNSVEVIHCVNTPIYKERCEKGLKKIHEENRDRKLKEISKRLQVLKVHYIILRWWNHYWWEEKDVKGNTRAGYHHINQCAGTNHKFVK